ncbi:DSD1 family PLP-dependent enzyme [Novosphingobium mangrovi (ex Hu et al. 2023)]|uniref:DSD1 family PLP-dependent enzyme n=1 Tax=Novosphingobium mangrovi (ex Hu et al. 2023) TaxID=2930094 RepID=A0ABT0ACQ5_9SPHN|nr:DSD1 family PLP-dependent enzyme [Novosphingobium mangrovi (ex Hu et al. 2023)]MCJ1960976.1 DSD1 family PLP-dependent enzyme [Novosphingobium mangrovi (ex Hu et al. 2023)]
MTRPAGNPALQPGGVNGHLIGVPGGPAQLRTPALVLDADLFETNLADMARRAADAGIALRPHAKTHKCAKIAKRQVGLGALGLCCAKLGEAEALADEGLSGLLITSPLVTPDSFARLIALSRKAPDTRCVCDNPQVALAMAEAAAAAGTTLEVLVDLDVGLQRSGARTVADAVELARVIAGHPSLRLGGIQGYAGHAMHIAGARARTAELEQVSGKVAALRDALSALDLPPAIITGGGTGSVDIDAALGIFTELQVGSYVFMDREYDDVWTSQGEAPPFAAALTLWTTVTSANQSGHCTLDAGCKALATEAGMPRVLDGAPRGARYEFFGDEQGKLVYADAGLAPCRPGDVVRLQPPHCDPTVNLHDWIHVVRGDRIVDIWPLVARGRMQ